MIENLKKVRHDRSGCLNFSLPIFLGVLLIVPTANAYIGPGAGFAIVSSTFFFIIVIFTVFSSLLFWPFRCLWGWFLRRKTSRRARLKRLVILGFDGLDPKLAQEFIDAGKLPNFTKLAKQGSFTTLQSTCPPVSPVAWSSFMTGCNPGKHAIYDFLSRDPNTYLPVLSSTKTGSATKFIKIGKYKFPLGKPSVRQLRKSKPFWNLLGEQGVASTIIRVPITFPPEKFRGRLLSGMCVPDLLGTQGTFSFFTSEPAENLDTIGGAVFQLSQYNGRLHGQLIGPPNPVSQTKQDMKLPFDVQLTDDKQAILSIAEHTLKLVPGEYSSWTKLTFKAGLGIKVHGIVRFLITELNPTFKLYVSPINIDPERPAMPISHPFAYAVYLAKKFDGYATLGLAEDTWGLNQGVLDDSAFLDQTYKNHQEREKMFFDALDNNRQGLVACVFDTSDRIQHMFWRYHNRQHPALDGKDRSAHQDSILEMYKKMDQTLGKTLKLLKPKDELLVMSDHGFNDFSRGVNINTWLRENGYLTLKKDCTGKGAWLEDADWENTRAYTLGLSGIYLNIKGREAQGIVSAGQEAKELRSELIQKLSGLKDAHNSNRVAINWVKDRQETYAGPYVSQAPDLIVGFNQGYRTSWDCAQGRSGEEIFTDNIKAWSGDHCMDPALVPGVLFTTFKHSSQNPRIIDIAPTALNLLGADIPKHIEGQSLKIDQLRRKP
jgi:predicted AlkP superfamily phosphohydrolase/phosphomutase